MESAEQFKQQIWKFFAMSNQQKWTRRQICERIDKEWERLSQKVSPSDSQLQQK